MINPSAVPGLPVLDWDGIAFGRGEKISSVIDDADLVFTSSGRAAILLGLEYLRVGAGDTVLVPTYHCPTMVAPIVAIGAEPLFYPIDETGEPRLDLLASRPLGNAKAMIVPHFFGVPRNLLKVREFCDARQIALIEDCAHCFFGSAGGRVVGHWGDLAIASLTKFFPVPSGGILASNRHTLGKLSLNPPGLIKEVKAVMDVLETAALAGRLWGVSALLGLLFSMKRLLRRSPVAPQSLAKGKISNVVTPEALRFDVKLAHQIPEAICRMMPAVSDRARIVRRRRENYLKLAQMLSGHPGFTPLFPDLPAGAAPYVFPLRVDAPDAKYQRLKESGLPVFRWNWLWPGTPAIEGDSGLLWSSEVFQLACHQDLTDDELQCIYTTVIAICGDRGQ